MEKNYMKNFGLICFVLSVLGCSISENSKKVEQIDRDQCLPNILDERWEIVGTKDLVYHDTQWGDLYAWDDESTVGNFPVLQCVAQATCRMCKDLSIELDCQDIPINDAPTFTVLDQRVEAVPGKPASHFTLFIYDAAMTQCTGHAGAWSVSCKSVGNVCIDSIP